VGFGAPAGLAPAEDGGRRDARIDSVFAGRLADPTKLRGLRALTGASRELEALRARYLDALIREGPDATETAVKVADRAALARGRYVIFSTHGLTAGEDGVSEPGLVLTPPDRPTELDDGYLTASEAAELDLHADLVILSACNTAAADGAYGGEGLSGLAKSFLYAGARSLLVSHWPILDDAAVELIGVTFRELDGDNAASRARALQKAVQAVRSRPQWADPAVWGAFALVGEPAR
jgi:CHAT domain-containing protein